MRSTASASICCSMGRPQPVRPRPAPADNAERKAQPGHQRQEPRAQQQGAQPSDRRRRIGFDGNQRVVDDGAQALATPPQLARVLSSISGVPPPAGGGAGVSIRSGLKSCSYNAPFNRHRFPLSESWAVT